ncbi:hypothetical protein J2T17_006044 [Paenibacillus mucilaginosus]|uniref:CBO0543 family protein n=1 Tax=Paenibacillus mucilaginosus TaxID=61624 RepID=UPI003D24E352
MSKEQIILLIINGITLAGLILLTPRSRLREAAVVYTFKQSITWVLGLLIVEYHLIDYPVREFVVANRTSFSFEFFVYPAICVIYNLHFPADRGWGRKWAWILVFPTVMTLFEVDTGEVYGSDRVCELDLVLDLAFPAGHFLRVERVLFVVQEGSLGTGSGASRRQGLKGQGAAKLVCGAGELLFE